MPAFIKISDDYTQNEKRKAYSDFWKMMMPVVGAIVANSLAAGAHKISNPTRRQVTERVDMCRHLVDMMRQQFKWSKWRIRDTLSMALRAQLSGIYIDFDRLAKRGAW